jgi:hypothetical protein
VGRGDTKQGRSASHLCGSWDLQGTVEPDLVQHHHTPLGDCPLGPNVLDCRRLVRLVRDAEVVIGIPRRWPDPEPLIQVE